MFGQHEGGCLCGQIRYRLDGDPVDAGFCHCRMCQRASGAPVVAWVTARTAHVTFAGPDPLAYRSSPGARRFFCGRCGTPLAFQADATPDLLDLTVASLDQPNLMPPHYHIWTQSRIAWFDTRDPLPRHTDSGPDQVG